MKKKLLYGAIAAVLVALNAFAFSSFNASASVSSSLAVARPDAACYQDMGYCEYSVTLKCKRTYTAWHCEKYACEDCGLSGATTLKDFGGRIAR